MSKKQVFNPYLPAGEYVPDGEPHLFDGRVYVYGSHDRFGGKAFCMNDYVCWSAPENDLTDWRMEGVIYRKSQDPDNPEGKKCLYAPDVCRGPDGRYYLYYAFDFWGKIGVAVCDTPAGRYEFLGYVHHPDGTPLGRAKGDKFQFDPGVYVEGNDVYLYTGFCPKGFPFNIMLGGRINRGGAMVTLLDRDMLTVRRAPRTVARGIYDSAGTPYEGHEFFEAASMRKIGEKYYFIYSSYLGHELCYAVGDSPDGDFEFGGTLVSIGDVGLRGIKGVKDAANFTGNTHGSVVCAGGKYYVFYHRQTNRHCYARQACAERITVLPDGSIPQAEVTSCGLGNAPLGGIGEYGARIACNLTCPAGGKFYSIFRGREGKRPYFTQSAPDYEYADGQGDEPYQYIANMRDGAQAGFKYFDLSRTHTVTVTVRGKARGRMIAAYSPGGEPAAVIPADLHTGEWTELPAVPLTGEKTAKNALFFRFEGEGRIDFLSFRLG